MSPTGAFLHIPPCLASVLTCPSFPPLPSLSFGCIHQLLPASNLSLYFLATDTHDVSPRRENPFDLSPDTTLMCSLSSSLPLELAPRTVVPAQGAPADSSLPLLGSIIPGLILLWTCRPGVPQVSSAEMSWARTLERSGTWGNV